VSRAFIVLRDGEKWWQVVTGYLRVTPHPLTMDAARLRGMARGLTRADANELARRLNEWANVGISDPAHKTP